MQPESDHTTSISLQLKESVRNLSPAYFGLVMATGIISIGSHLAGMKLFASILFEVNIFAFCLLWILYLVRLIFYTRNLTNDLKDHQEGMGFFTVVAGTAIVGTQFIVIADHYTIAAILLALSVFLWIVLTSAIFPILTVKEQKPPLSEGLSGGWLLAVVSVQSVSVLTTLVASRWNQPYKLEANFFAFSMWLWGGMLYIWMISLIFYRYTFFRFSPGDLAPPYWINMGAMAISTLAGSLLILNVEHAPFLTSLLPFIKGFTIFYWATGTWWIPMLIILALWRHVYKKFPLTYNPLYWGAVFPLGMYTVATLRMSQAMDLDFLLPVPKYFIYLAIFSWILAFIGLVNKQILLFFPVRKRRFSFNKRAP